MQKPWSVIVPRNDGFMVPTGCARDGGIVLIPFCSIDQLLDAGWEEHLHPEPNVVHLWGVRMNESPGCLEQCARWLDEEEQRRAARLVREDDRQRYVLAHGGLRTVLGRYLRISPDVVELRRDKGGKPFVAGKLRNQSLTFNMSHAHGRVLIGVSKGQEVGVDLERIRSDVEVEKLSERYFAPSEYASMMRVTEEERAARFFRYWVAKEAVLKAQGIGLRGLSQCEILFGADGVGAEVLVPVGSPLKDNWKVRLLSCDEGWEAAVAAQRIERVVPCSLVQ